MILSSGLCLLLAALCSASMTIVLRLFPASSSCRYGILLGNYLTCTVTGFLLLSDKSMLFQAHASTVLCGLLGGLSRAFPDMADSQFYKLLDIFSNAALTFLPILIAVSAAKIFGARGSVTFHNTDIYGDCAPASMMLPCCSIWPFLPLTSLP